jgi:hypothetical protein
MSFSAYMQPIPPDPPPIEYLGYQIKFALARRFWDGNYASRTEPLALDGSHAEWLWGVAHAADGDRAGEVKHLLDAIARYGRVWVWIGDATDAPLPGKVKDDDDDGGTSNP